MSDIDADQTEADPQQAGAPPPDDGTIRASIVRLIASGREFAEAELAWAKLKGAIVADGLRKWLILTSLALIFLVLGVVILIGSAVIALAPYVGWLGASLVVAGTAIVLAVLFALAARRTFIGIFEEKRR